MHQPRRYELRGGQRSSWRAHIPAIIRPIVAGAQLLTGGSIEMAELKRTRFSVAESARIIGGQLITTHTDRCATHRGEPCACDPRYALRRTGRKGARGR